MSTCDCNAQLLSQSQHDSIDVCVLRPTQLTSWYLKVTTGADTLFSGYITRDTTNFRLPVNKSYFVNFYQPDTNVWANFYLNPRITPVPRVEFICTNRTILVSDKGIEDYSKEVQSFRDLTFQILQTPSQEPHSSKLTRIDSLADQLEHRLCSQLLLSGTCIDVHTALIVPIKSFLQECRARYAVIDQLSQKDSMTIVRFIIDHHSKQRAATGTFGLSSERGEALLLIKQMAYAMALRLPSILYKMMPTIRRGKNTVEIGVLTSYLVGDERPCEVAYGLLTRARWNPGIDYVDCSEPLPQYIVSLRREGEGYFCDVFDREYEDYCLSLENDSVSSIQAYDRSGSLVTRVLHKDSVYVLHFWGTWCKACLDNHDEIMRVSDSLKALGCTVLHIAYQVKSTLSKWQKFISGIDGEQFLIATDPSNKSAIVHKLNVASYPSYVIIDKHNRVVLPWPSWHDAVVGRVRELQNTK